MNVHKVPAHPERAETDKRKWARHMWGNHLTDIDASSDPYPLVREGFEDIVQIGIDIDDILQSIAISPGLFWGRRDGVPILESLMDARHQSTLLRYLKRRDKYRADRGDGPKWVGRTIQHGVKTWEMKWRNEADKSRMVRIRWDWFHHGGNKRKHNRRDKGICEMCDQPDSQAHWMSECRNLGCERTRNIYEKEITNYIESIDEDEKLTEFCKEIQKLGTKELSGHMVRLGFYGTADLDALSSKFPGDLTEDRWKVFEKAALDMGHIWIEGTLRTYVHKLHKGKGEPNDEYYQRVRRNRVSRAEKSKVYAEKRAASKKVKTKSDLLKLYEELSRVSYHGELASARQGVG